METQPKENVVCSVTSPPQCDDSGVPEMSLRKLTPVEGSTNWTRDRSTWKKEKRRQQRERRKLEANLKKVSLEQKGSGSSDTGKPANETQTTGRSSDLKPTSRSKRLRSDGAQEEGAKKPCTEERSYSGAAGKDIMVRIIAKDGEKPLTGEDMAYIIEKVDTAMICQNPKNIKVASTYLFREAVRVVCKSPQTVDWLKVVVRDLPVPHEGHPGYLALGPRDIPPTKKFFVWVSGKKDPAKIIQLLNFNEGIDTKAFHIRKVIPNDGGDTFIFGVEPKGVKWLESVDFKPFCGMGGNLHFRQSIQKAKEAGQDVPGLQEKKEFKEIPEEGRNEEDALAMEELIPAGGKRSVLREPTLILKERDVETKEGETKEKELGVLGDEREDGETSSQVDPSLMDSTN